MAISNGNKTPKKSISELRQETSQMLNKSMQPTSNESAD